MKNITLKNTCNLLAGFAFVFTFNSCEQADIVPETTPMAQSAENARNNASFNLDNVYEVNFGALNDSGVSGIATLTLMGDKLTVRITASGLTPDRVHPQHIHGFVDTNKNATCPPMSADTDNDGILEVGEGAPFYGPILLPLMPFPTANDQGMITYEQTFDVSADLLPLQNRVIVLHGKMVDGTYFATVPVACGQIMVRNNGKK